MAKMIPAAERIVRARKLIQKARDLPVPEGGMGKSDFSYIAQVKDLLRQAREDVEYTLHRPGAGPGDGGQVLLNGKRLEDVALLRRPAHAGVNAPLGALARVGNPRELGVQPTHPGAGLINTAATGHMTRRHIALETRTKSTWRRDTSRSSTALDMSLSVPRAHVVVQCDPHGGMR